LTVRYNVTMNEKYRLVFRGEVLDGQHRAVVKRRLAESLKLTDEQAEKLFSGAAVVLKKSVDVGMAARYQALFKQAGGRLRVHSLAPAAATDNPDLPTPFIPDAATEPTIPEPAATKLSTPEATSKIVAPAVAATGVTSPAFALLSLEEIDKAVAEASGERVEINAPDFAIAELGTDLADSAETVVVVLPEADFSLAAAGEDLLEVRPEPAAIELGPLDFDVAEVGVALVEPTDRPVPAAPDISHLQIAEEA
jgi:hypothetical protein